MPTKRQVANIIREAYDKLGTWQDVNDVLYGGRMSNVVLSRIANPTDTYWPVEKEYTDLLQPPKDKPDYRLRPVQHLCTGAEYLEMIKPTTRERTLRALKEK